ncbi:MAG: hypothetical protein ACRDJM_08355, partial [Actinomycetota bacterium]
MRRVGSIRAIARIAVTLALMAGFVVPASVLAGAQQRGLEVAGVMPFGADFSQAPEMLVDSTRHLGFAQAYIRGELRLVVYDLLRMKVARVVSSPRTLSFSGSAVDERHHRVFFAADGPFAFSCGGLGSPSEVLVLDSVTFRWTSKRVDCIGSEEFIVRSLAYHDPSGTLYAFGAPSGEQLTESLRPDSKAIRIRAMDPDTLAERWTIDAASGCDNGDNRPYPELVARVGNMLFSYCYRNGPAGSLGLAMRIPLDGNGAPEIEGGRPRVLTEPTLPQRVAPFIDPATGRMIIFTAGPPNGQAAWVFDPRSGRFAGAIPSGAPNAPQASLFLGFDARSGRLYILNSRGIVVADIRHRPLPSGVSYPVLDKVRDNNSGLFIAVDSSLRRLFVPVLGKGFVVVEDRVPQPRPVPAPDPDEGTADIPEVPGETDVATASIATAFGVHLLNTGGIPRAIDTFDPLCNEVQGGINDKDPSGRCPADLVLTPGNREYFLSDSRIETGSDSGVSALAGAGRSPSTDSATDADFRSIARCLHDKAPAEVPAVCSTDTPVVSDFRHGTHGADGKGFPVPSAQCNDFGGAKADDREVHQAGSSDAQCDAAKTYALGAARAAGFAYPSDPLISVARSESRTETRITARGLETVATATATGVRIGDVTIGRIMTTATTRARGRSGTSFSSFEREFAGVQAAGMQCVAACDPAEVVAAINTALGPTVRARLPQPSRLASPHGFQGVVTKDPDLLESDRTINDDDTQTVNGLDVIVYNDGKNGRSRLVVGIAGVQAESRYGIFPLSEGVEGGVDTVVGGVREDLPPNPGTGLPDTVVPPAPVSPGAPPARVVADAFRFVRLRPGEAALLFL